MDDSPMTYADYMRQILGMRLTRGLNGLTQGMAQEMIARYRFDSHKRTGMGTLQRRFQMLLVNSFSLVSNLLGIL